MVDLRLVRVVPPFFLDWSLLFGLGEVSIIMEALPRGGGWDDLLQGPGGGSGRARPWGPSFLSGFIALCSMNCGITGHPGP